MEGGHLSAEEDTPGVPPRLVPYKIAQWREIIRSALAILTVVTALSVTIALAIAMLSNSVTDTEARDLASIVLPPLYGLAGVAVAFYLSGKDSAA